MIRGYLEIVAWSLWESPDFIKTDAYRMLKKATAVMSFPYAGGSAAARTTGKQIRPYEVEDAVFDPTLVDEVPSRRNQRWRHRRKSPLWESCQEHSSVADVNTLFGALKRDGEVRIFRTICRGRGRQSKFGGYSTIRGKAGCLKRARPMRWMLCRCGVADRTGRQHL